LADASKKSADDGAGSLPAPARASRGIVQFSREVWREGIEKTTWPTWKETWLTTLVVFIMVALMMVFFFGVDYVLAQGERWLVGALG
jgi:preprotein translocase subunit SecE